MKAFKMKSLALVSLFSIILLFASCSDDKEETLLPVEERIVGTWTIKSSIVFGQEIPGDDSSLTFNECGDTCTGEDFLASDESTGTFTYSFLENGTVLSIEDNDADAGGSYSGDWEIENFTNNTLTFGADTFLGKVSFTFTK